MQQPKDNLFTRFREDHQVLGAGFHQLSAHLRTGDTAEACAVARYLPLSRVVPTCSVLETHS